MAHDTESETDDSSSPWPIPIAFGIVLAEVGVLFGLRPVSVGGLLLFAGSFAAILQEAGYVADRLRTLGLLGFVLVGLGIALLQVDLPGAAFRGQSIAIAGVVSLLAVLGLLGFRWHGREEPIGG